MPFIGPKPADTVLDSTLIADGSITSAKIADGAIVNADLNNSAAIATSKITGLAASATTDTTNAANISSGTISDARISASSVQQHATSFDDNKLVNDISTLAIRQASNENKGAYNTNSMFVDVFQDDTGIASNTNAPRNSSEYVSTLTAGALNNSYTNFSSSNFGSVSNWAWSYNNLTINSTENKKIKINRIENTKLDGVENHMYVRDLKEFWIIHSRLFPSKKPKQYNLRWISNYFWVSLNFRISKIISCLPFIGKTLWYRKERLGKKALEIQLIGLIKILKNEKIKQKVRIKYNQNDNF